MRQFFIWVARIFFHKQIMGDWFLYHWLPSQLPVFAIGIILYFVLKKNLRVSVKSKNLLLIGSLLVTSLTIFFSIYHNFFPMHVVISIPIGIVAFLMSQFKMNFFNNIFLRFLGKISFSIYISHFAFLHFISNFVNQLGFEPAPAYLIRFVMLTSISMLVSYVLYRIVEIPGIAIGKGVIEKYRNIQNLTV